jgi:hypothetical protein
LPAKVRNIFRTANFIRKKSVEGTFTGFLNEKEGRENGKDGMKNGEERRENERGWRAT